MVAGYLKYLAAAHRGCVQFCAWGCFVVKIDDPALSSEGLAECSLISATTLQSKSKCWATATVVGANARWTWRSY